MICCLMMISWFRMIARCMNEDEFEEQDPIYVKYLEVDNAYKIVLIPLNFDLNSEPYKMRKVICWSKGRMLEWHCGSI